MTDKEAMKLALEALDIAQGMLADLKSQHQPKMLSAYTAIKEALAEHAMREVQRLGQEIEQEPVGMVKDLFTSTAWEKLDVRGSTKVYLATPLQRTWVGLTDDDDIDWEEGGNLRDLVKAIEQALKEKNT